MRSQTWLWNPPYPLSRPEWPALRDIARRARWLTKYRLAPKAGSAGLWMVALNIEGVTKSGRPRNMLPL